MKDVRFIVIDISNSQTKIAASDGESLGEVRWIPTPEVDAATLAAAAAPDASDLPVALASVVPERTKAAREAFGPRLLEVSPRVRLGIEIDYPDPDSIGADRLANAAALAAMGWVPGVVIDFGTAVTFDIVDRGPRYVGGVIAPGLEVMTDYMFQRTALLPKIDLREPTEVIGKSTRSGMLSGAIHGYRGLIKEVLAEVSNAIGAGELRVVATGGYAELIAARLPAIEAVDPALTLHGLRTIALLNF